MSEELKACPFCGEPADYYSFAIMGENREVYQCVNLKCWLHHKATDLNGWNTRPLEDGFRAALEKVSGALDEEIHSKPCDLYYTEAIASLERELVGQIEELRAKLDQAVLNLITPELEAARARIKSLEVINQTFISAKAASRIAELENELQNARDFRNADPSASMANALYAVNMEWAHSLQARIAELETKLADSEKHRARCYWPQVTK